MLSRFRTGSTAGNRGLPTPDFVARRAALKALAVLGLSTFAVGAPISSARAVEKGASRRMAQADTGANRRNDDAGSLLPLTQLLAYPRPVVEAPQGAVSAAAFPVRGVTCDNGLNVPLGHWTYVVIPLPLDLDVANPPVVEVTKLSPAADGEGTASADGLQPQPNEALLVRVAKMLTEQGGAAAQLFGANANAALLAADTGMAVYRPERREVWYFPPLEFNETQARDEGGNIHLTLGRSRLVDVRVRGRRLASPAGNALAGNAQGGSVPFEGSARIALYRPPVLLVHGINNEAWHWNGEKGVGVRPSLEAWGFSTHAINYGENDLERAGVRRAGARYFRGNAPVEFAANELDGEVRKVLEHRRGAGVVTNRVDVLGHSYGGVVSRWYVMTRSRTAVERAALPRTMPWYVNSSNNETGRNMYKIDPGLYSTGLAAGQGPAGTSGYHHVRKLITIASPWRGTPIANFVNEVHGPAPTDGPSLGSMTAGWRGVSPFKLSSVISKLIKPVAVPDDVPSLEVGAVESRWLRLLNRTPFQPDIAYDAVAGNDNAYLAGHVDVFTSIVKALPPSALLVLEKERISRRRHNVTDGLIPVWSAVIEPRSRVVLAAHNSVLWNDEVKTHVAQSLSDAGLHGGTALNTRWGRPWTFSLGLPAEDRLAPEVRTWVFKPGAMAPQDRADAYQLRTPNGVATDGSEDAVARFNPEAISEP